MLGGERLLLVVAVVVGFVVEGVMAAVEGFGVAMVVVAFPPEEEEVVVVGVVEEQVGPNC
jgi:hypothetical protein